MSNYLHCAICDKGIEVWAPDDFNYTREADGPYCDRCWAFMELIESLRERVTALEEDIQTRQRKPLPKKGPSPYDAGARRRVNVDHPERNA